MIIRPVVAADKAALMSVWHQGWHDAHADLVPSEILQFREPEHFMSWYDEAEETICVAIIDGVLVGFYGLIHAELSKLYVDRPRRGSTVAQDLLVHAETALMNSGIHLAELYCTAGNIRAQRFYERQHWQLQETFMDRLWLPAGAPCEGEVQTHRYTKRLGE